MQLIERVELTSSQASITISSIANTFTDLFILFSARSSQAGGANWTDTNFRPNGATTNRSERSLYGTGTGVGSYSDTSSITLRVCTDSNTASTFSSYAIYIPNYASSSAKSISIDGVTENNASAAWQSIHAALWNSSTAISSLEFNGQGYNFLSGSSVTLYGITKGSDGTTTVS